MWPTYVVGVFEIAVYLLKIREACKDFSFFHFPMAPSREHSDFADVLVRFCVMKRIFALRARGSADIRHHFSANSHTPYFVVFDAVPRGGQ